MKTEVNNLTGYELVNGMFTAEEAREVLMSLISSKLRFHSKKNLHSYERSGVEDPKSEERINELQQLRKQILAELEKANEEGLMAELQANVQLKFREPVSK
ncbi:hypothetical protein ACG2F4_14900 [Halalkalibaculum sp. DA3122]|uniref:hypothetical protein n=1 Tax=Halalkalibaculum sp. DA3122 TaxID=3373607 RepID=UPI00375514F4